VKLHHPGLAGVRADGKRGMATAIAHAVAPDDVTGVAKSVHILLQYFTGYELVGATSLGQGQPLVGFDLLSFWTRLVHRHEPCCLVHICLAVALSIVGEEYTVTQSSLQ